MKITEDAILERISARIQNKDSKQPSYVIMGERIYEICVFNYLHLYKDEKGNTLDDPKARILEYVYGLPIVVDTENKYKFEVVYDLSFKDEE